MSLCLTPHKTHESFAPVNIIEVYSIDVSVDSAQLTCDAPHKQWVWREALSQSQRSPDHVITPLRHPISLFAYFLCLSSSSWNKFTGILKGKQEVSRLQRGHVFWINEWQFYRINSGSLIFAIALTKYMHPWLFFDEFGTPFVYESRSSDLHIPFFSTFSFSNLNWEFAIVWMTFSGIVIRNNKLKWMK